ncbi:hypothetical protein [Sporolactobacillus pectinivorans]|uniref:hypothetical protein n=1 Tax=Sporolactobacillus pectinivorans TaxID=1591408 RepID=UPI000C26AD4B|nr:hypothetical protein [Sporolactobacillus pectinivorans]
MADADSGNSKLASEAEQVMEDIQSVKNAKLADAFDHNFLIAGLILLIVSPVGLFTDRRRESEANLVSVKKLFNRNGLILILHSVLIKEASERKISTFFLPVLFPVYRSGSHFIMKSVNS